MLRFTDTKIVFREVPDEISLAINISGCPFACKGCHSSFLQGEIGDELSFDVLDALIKKNDLASCVLFMGGDKSPAELSEFASYVKYNYPDKKVAWYSGYDFIHSDAKVECFDYIKIGRYIELLGGLDSLNTNQRIYKINNGSELIDLTHRMKSKFATEVGARNIL